MRSWLWAVVLVILFFCRICNNYLGFSVGSPCIFCKAFFVDMQMLLDWRMILVQTKTKHSWPNIACIVYKYARNRTISCHPLPSCSPPFSPIQLHCWLCLIVSQLICDIRPWHFKFPKQGISCCFLSHVWDTFIGVPVDSSTDQFGDKTYIQYIHKSFIKMIKWWQNASSWQ